MDVSAKKSLGQNFLKDEAILKKIANSVDVTENDFILEIGPGKGALTKYLLQKPSKYLAYEIDERMRPILESMTSQVIFDDFLSCDLKQDLKNISYERLFVVANIPYYITTPIIEHLIESKLSISAMVLLVQKEVADRFCAKPHTKDYGYFTVYLDYYFRVSKLFDVSRNCFQPVPNVDSAVVCFKKKERSILDEEAYFRFLKLCFSNKRKTLKNNLKQYDWNQCLSILKEYGYLESVRAEELPSEVFQALFLGLHL